LLGLLKDTEGAGGKLLSHWRINYQMVWNRIDRTIGHRDKEKPLGLLPSTRVRNIIRLASREADGTGADSVGTEHVLLAIMAEGQSTAANLLSDLSVTAAQVRTELDRLNLRKG